MQQLSNTKDTPSQKRYLKICGRSQKALGKLTTKRETTGRTNERIKNHTNQIAVNNNNNNKLPCCTVSNSFTSRSSQQTHFQYYTGAKQTTSIFGARL